MTAKRLKFENARLPPEPLANVTAERETGKCQLALDLSLAFAALRPRGPEQSPA